MWERQEDGTYRKVEGEAKPERKPWWYWALGIVGWLLFLSLLNEVFGTSRGGWLI